MDDSFKMFGSNISRIRHKRHMTKDELSRMSGISKIHITEIENGLYKVNAYKLQSIASVLNVTLGDILKQPKRRDD